MEQEQLMLRGEKVKQYFLLAMKEIGMQTSAILDPLVDQPEEWLNAVTAILAVMTHSAKLCELILEDESVPKHVRDELVKRMTPHIRTALTQWGFETGMALKEGLEDEDVARS